MPSSKVQPNRPSQTRKNNNGPNDPKYRKLFNKARLPNRTWKNYAKSFAPKWGNNEAGRVFKEPTGWFRTRKINPEIPENTTTLPSNIISPNIITNARTTNHDLLRRLWRQFNDKRNDIDFIPRIDTLEKIGKFEIELECYMNKDKPAKTQAQRNALVKRLTDKGVSQNEAAKVLCSYTSTSTTDDLKKRLNALNLPVTPELIEEAIHTLTLPKAVEIEKRKIVTGLIILRLILSDQLIVRLKSDHSNVVEPSFEKLTTFGKVLRAAAWITLVSTVIFEVPGILISEFPQEYMDYQTNLEVQIPAYFHFENMTTNFLNQRYGNTEKRISTDKSLSGQTTADWLYTDCRANNDEDALDKYISMTKDYILANNKLPTPEVDQALIDKINKDYPLRNFKLVPDKYTNSSGKSESSVDVSFAHRFLAPRLGIDKGFAWMTPSAGFYKLVKAMGFRGSITGIKSVIAGATSWSAVGGIVLIRKLHSLVKTYLNERSKKDVSDYIDSFLLEFPVAVNLIKNTDYIESFSIDTTLNLMIQGYIRELLKKDYESKKTEEELLYGTIFRENVKNVNANIERTKRSATNAEFAYALGEATADTVATRLDKYDGFHSNLNERMYATRLSLAKQRHARLEAQSNILSPNDIKPINFKNFNSLTPSEYNKHIGLAPRAARGARTVKFKNSPPNIRILENAPNDSKYMKFMKLFKKAGLTYEK